MPYEVAIVDGRTGYAESTFRSRSISALRQGYSGSVQDKQAVLGFRHEPSYSSVEVGVTLHPVRRYRDGPRLCLPGEWEVKAQHEPRLCLVSDKSPLSDCDID
jgi:hypothetical protein